VQASFQEVLDVVLKLLGMILLSVVTVVAIGQMLGGHLDYKYFFYVIAAFFSGIFIYHYYFIWFPKAVQQSNSLFCGVKLIYTSVEETVIDKELRSRVIAGIDRSLMVLGSVIDERLKHMGNPSPFKLSLFKANSLEKEWRRFYMEAFAVIERELDDETIRQWTFNKIRNKLNYDRTGQSVKNVLKSIVGDSKYAYLVK